MTHTPGTAVGGVEAAPSSTPTRTPSPTPGRSPTPSPTALAEQHEPDTGGGNDGQSSTPIGGTDGGDRPDWVQSLPRIGDVNTSADVILTNLALAGFSLMLLFLSAEIFNQTIEENENDIKGLMRKYAGPVIAVGEGIGSVWDALFAERHMLATLAAAPIILTLAAVLYIFEEPGFGFNNQTLVLLLSVLISVAYLTYMFDGLQVFLAKTVGVKAVLRLFPVGIFVAAFCVAFTRVDGMQPGLIYGFIAASAIVGERKLTTEQDGRNVFIPSMLLLLSALVLWLCSRRSETWLRTIAAGTRRCRKRWRRASSWGRCRACSCKTSR